IPVNDEKSFWRFINAYTLTVPEIWPSINTRVREINKSKLTNLRIADAAPSSLITFLLREVKEDDGIPETLEPPKIQAMNWVDSACLGSWKLAQVFWFPNKVGEPELKRVVVSTLEGSHAQYGSQGEGLQFKGSVDEIAKELGRRFMIFGSTKEVETDHEVDKDLKPLTPAAWAAMPAVKSLIKTGEFLGDRKLISGEVKIEDLVKSRALKRGLPLLASWSQQAESARCLWEPTIDELVVTITGKLGGSKTKMTPKDLVAVRPKPGTQNDLLLRKVKGRKTLSPSVEAREFAIPLYKMGESEEGFKFKVRRNQDGSYTPDENGKFDMWRIVGIDHLHRDVKVDQINRDKIIVIEPEDYDAVGCGVDANDEKSEYAIKQAYKQGLEFFNERGYWPTSAVFYVPNHGWNAILFANENQQGNFDSDLGKGFRDAIENGDLVYGTFAEGVTQV
ncbi:MAG TPA: hypothetical protein VFB03_00365, partial [Candidatus Saccharimonadales bacterium]|nr:hypothetical protein [Candidatus Saccharimonadales bacterium]